MFKKQLSILLVIFWLQNSSCFIVELFGVVDEGMKVARFVNDIIFTKDTATAISLMLSNTDENQQIIDSLDGINKKLDYLRDYTTHRLNSIESLIRQLPDEIVQRFKRSDSELFMKIIDDKWNRLRAYMKAGSNEDVFHRLADEILGFTKIPLIEFRSNIASYSDGLFMLISRHGDNQRDFLCDDGPTSHHIIVNLFRTVIVTEIKAHVLQCLAHMIIHPEKNVWKTDVNLLKTELVEQFKIYIDVFLESLNTTEPPYVRACNPQDWKRGNTFHALDGLIQQTIYSLISRGSDGSGGLTCSQMGELHNKAMSASMIPMTRHSECRGLIHSCHALYTWWGYGAYACFWKKGPYRIRWMEHYGKKFGTDVSSLCPESDYYKKSWYWNWPTDTFCSCQCTTEKYMFYIRILRSRVKENYVIAGMQIKRTNGFFYIQIAEGKLEANGYISNFSWVSPVRTIDGEESTYPDAITVKVHDSIFFDDVQLRPGHVLTGVQFAPVERDGKKGFTIRVVGTKFDYGTGKLDLNGVDDPWPRNLRANNVLEYSAQDPIKEKPADPILPNSRGFTHVVIRQSILEHDYGQTTLPFFDGVPVLNSPLSPIGGVGLFHKSYDREHGGFISLRIYPINYTYFMDTFLQTYNFSSLMTLIP